MSDDLNGWLNIQVCVKASQPELLTGLDQWLRLGLITEAQVIGLSRQYLTCLLPEIKTTSIISDRQQNNFQLIAINSVKDEQKFNFIFQFWQAFKDELSIRWLLFLGIFLVIVSSGVLAATQWHSFPAFGQYLILWLYTLSFWLIGCWLNQQDNLQLTSQTIKKIAILLVPIDFWAMSSLDFTSSLLGWGIIAIAGFSLSGITYLNHRQSNQNSSNFYLFLFLLLSYLHLGWDLPKFSLLAIYLGIIAIAAANHWLFLKKQHSKYKTTNLLFLLTTWSLLLIRIFLTDEDSIADLGLAIALCGWLLASIYLRLEKIVTSVLTKVDSYQSLNIIFLNKIFQPISTMLIIFGWSISLLGGLFESQLLFWQTTAINGLAIHLSSQKLRNYWRKRDLLTIFLIGLQGIFIAKELIPPQLRKNVLNFSVEITQTTYFPESVFGVTLFPYLLIFVIVASWLDRQQKYQLARFTEWLTLLFGIVLTSLSLSNPTWRSLNLFLSTATLGYVAYIRQPLRVTQIYLTHGLGLIAVGNAIAILLPNLSLSGWGSILVLLAIAEWTLLITTRKATKLLLNRQYWQTWHSSYWYFGLLLAGLSYSCLVSQIYLNSFGQLIWLLIPLMLTLIARNTRRIQQRRLAALLSSVALVAVQILTLASLETRIISFAIAIGLMFANAYYLRRLSVTVIHWGLILGAIASVVWEWVTGWNWLIIGAIAVIGLYRVKGYLQKILATPKVDYISQRTALGRLGVGREINNFKLVRKYCQAAAYWAMAITAVELTVLTLEYLDFFNNQQLAIAPELYLITSLSIGGAILFDCWQTPNLLSLYTCCWLIELAVFSTMVMLGSPEIAIALANILLGFCFLWLIPRLSTPIPRSNLTSIPLLYGTLGILWRLNYFNAYTGWLTLGAAIIGIGVNSQTTKHKILPYLSLAGISLAVYELVIYQMWQSSGGKAADGLTILGLVAAIIAFGYRLIAWWWHKYRQQQLLFNLNLNRLILVAHLHWAIGSILKIIAAGIAIELAMPRFRLLSIAVSLFLGAYAVVQGKDTPTELETATTNPARDWWVYVGLVEIAATIVYSRLIISKLSLFDPWRIVFTCAIALIIYQIPWQNFGWRATPWKHTALIIPALMAMVNAEDITYLSLAIAAAFYLRIAYYQRNLRWSYVSLAFLDWAIFKLLWQYQAESIWLAIAIGCSIFYIAQFDPYLRGNRSQRHRLRLVGSNIIAISALFYQDTGLIPSAVGLIMLLAGLGLRIRAFLYVGTITFILTIIYQLVLLVATYSFLKWILGLVTGIVAIVVAANFESQRHGIQERVQSYVNRFEQWQ